MAIRYDGIRKKRRVYVDQDSNLVPLSKLGGAGHYYGVAASGTLNGSGALTVTGTQFKSDSIVVACYNKDSAGTVPMAVEMGSGTSGYTAEGTVSFSGDASEKFYYILIN